MSAFFSGSYERADVRFLLTPLQMDPIGDLEEKERLIQSGEKHYSEMIAPEWLPTNEYFSLYEAALNHGAAKVAEDALSLAARLRQRRPHGVTLVSLARAGTPVGILLKRFLETRLRCSAEHYSISIIRDRGIDANALDFIRTQHADETLCFVDGWTGKGAIAGELRKTVADYNRSRNAAVPDELFVLADLAGLATDSGSDEDYLIPSAILNAPVSGLVSRTILNELVGPEDWHGCLYYDQWKPHDRSRTFVDTVTEAGSLLELPDARHRPWSSSRANLMRQFVAAVMACYSITNPNLVKPGIGEATRAVLRRAPQQVLVKSLELASLEHLIWLCRERGVPVTVNRAMPVNALAIIRKLGDV